MSEERFIVVYDGPALAEHVMDVKDLAPALLALSEAFHQAQHVLTPDTPQVNLSIKAFDGGSFEIVMLLTETAGMLDAALDILTGRHVAAVGGLATLTGAVWGSIKAIKWLGGRKIKGAREMPGGRFMLIADDDTTLEVQSTVVPLIRDVEYRRRVTEVVKPLGQDGIDVFRVTDEELRVALSSDDLPAFAAPDVPDEDLGTSHRETTLQLLGVEFDSRKWRFTEGATPLSAAIEDERFQHQIERQEITFGKNDLLRVRLRTRQYRDASGRLKAEHAVEHVIRHIDGGRQLPLELGE